METLRDWLSDNSGEVVGATIAVLVGFGASELIGWWKQRQDRKRVRALMAEEVALNYARVERMNQAIDDKAGVIESYRVVAVGPRPMFTNLGLTSHLNRVPDAISEEGLSRLLTMHTDLDTLAGIWESVHAAFHADLLNQPVQVIQSSPSGLPAGSQFTMPSGRKVMGTTVSVVWDTYLSTLDTVLERDRDLAGLVRRGG